MLPDLSNFSEISWVKGYVEHTLSLPLSLYSEGIRFVQSVDVFGSRQGSINYVGTESRVIVSCKADHL